MTSSNQRIEDMIQRLENESNDLRDTWIRKIAQMFKSEINPSNEKAEKQAEKWIRNLLTAIKKSVQMEWNDGRKTKYNDLSYEALQIPSPEDNPEIASLILYIKLNQMMEDLQDNTDPSKILYDLVKRDDQFKTSIGQCLYFMAHLANQSREIQASIQPKTKKDLFLFGEEDGQFLQETSFGEDLYPADPVFV